MKLFMHEVDGLEKLGLILNDSDYYFDMEDIAREFLGPSIKHTTETFSSIQKILMLGADGRQLLRQVADFKPDKDLEKHARDLSSVKYCPPVKPSKCFSVGGTTLRNRPDVINYVKPMIKLGSAISGHKDTVYIPDGVKKTHVSAELCAIIGTKVHHATLKQAGEAISGYTMGNDIAALSIVNMNRDLASTSKSLDGFAAIGPVMVPSEHIDPSNIDLELRINNKTMVTSNTSYSIFGADRIVMDISSLITLLPGDTIFCGNIGVEPLVHPGDVTDCIGGGIGTLTTCFRQGNWALPSSYVKEISKQV